MKPVILDHLPDSLLSTSANELHRHLAGPTIIHLPGQAVKPVVVSVLQHGNETSGWDALRRLLQGRYQRDPLPRSLTIFIGNIEAAKHNLRHMPDQPDLNRCWPGSIEPANPWHDTLAQITDHIKRLEPFASIDIHNNTGKNPHYAAVNTIDPRSLQLASEFSKTVVYFTNPRGVQSQAFGTFCPSVTLECGLANEPAGADHAMSYLEHVLRIQALPSSFPSPERLELYQMLATLTIDRQTEFEFSSSFETAPTKKGLVFPSELDHHNFLEWPPGFVLAKAGNELPPPIVATGHQGQDLTHNYLRFKDGLVVTKRPLMPAMLTLDPFAIRNDCLCYLMEQVNIPKLTRGDRQAAMNSSLPEAPDQ